LGITLWATVVHIHPFIDGNGRSSGLLADLAFAAAQDGDELIEYAWDVDRRRYIRLLGHFDLTRDAGPLVDLVGVRRLGREVARWAGVHVLASPSTPSPGRLVRSVS
jgi:hypothetical protein